MTDVIFTRLNDSYTKYHNLTIYYSVNAYTNPFTVLDPNSFNFRIDLDYNQQPFKLSFTDDKKYKLYYSDFIADNDFPTEYKTLYFDNLSDVNKFINDNYTVLTDPSDYIYYRHPDKNNQTVNPIFSP